MLFKKFFNICFKMNKCILIGLFVIYFLNLKLWDENIWYRIYMHQYVKNRLDLNKIPFIKEGPKLPPDLHQKALHICDKCCTLKPSNLTEKYKAFHADKKGGAIYWNQLKKFVLEDKELEKSISDVKIFAKKFAEESVGTELYSFYFSMWNTFVLKYTGTQGSFGWHYDSEDDEDYRVLFCVYKTKTCGKVQYIDEKNTVQTIDLEYGQGYILRGSTTYHRVLNNEQPDDERLMLGFHFSKKPNKVTKNLCYFSNLTNWEVKDALNVFLNQDKY